MRLTVRGQVALALVFIALVLLANHTLGLSAVPSDCP